MKVKNVVKRRPRHLMWKSLKGTQGSAAEGESLKCDVLKETSG